MWNEAMKGHGIARSQRSPRHRPPTPSAPPPAALGRIWSSLARLERRYDALSSLLHMYMGGWGQSPSCPYGSYSGFATTPCRVEFFVEASLFHDGSGSERYRRPRSRYSRQRGNRGDRP